MRLLKELYTLLPMSVRELADKFLAYFKSHKRKILKRYYDGSMNNYKGVGSDMSTQI